VWLDTIVFHLVITCDYELPAGGHGDVRRHMIEPTAKLLEVCEQHGAKLTIMVEIGELWAFEKPENSRFKEHLGYDPAPLIRQQLREAVRRGHDVQLHLHPHWIHARWKAPCWSLDYNHYQLTDFGINETVALLRQGKEDLETMLHPCCDDYECVGFRAGHWNTQPSHRYLAALREAGLRSDTSVFKWGYRDGGGTTFDYRRAFSNVLAWYACGDDINQATSETTILEVPIATELVRYFRMLTVRRLRLGLRFLREDYEISAATAILKSASAQTRLRRFPLQLRQFWGQHPRKLDFCKLTAREMQSSIERLINQFSGYSRDLPIPLVMIGHSKELQEPLDVGMALGVFANQLRSKIVFSNYRSFFSTYSKRALARIEHCGGRAPTT
jgi:hypothetical protein